MWTGRGAKNAFRSPARSRAERSSAATISTGPGAPSSAAIRAASRYGRREAETYASTVLSDAPRAARSARKRSFWSAISSRGLSDIVERVAPAWRTLALRARRTPESAIRVVPPGTGPASDDASGVPDRGCSPRKYGLGLDVVVDRDVGSGGLRSGGRIHPGHLLNRRHQPLFSKALVRVRRLPDVGDRPFAVHLTDPVEDQARRHVVFDAHLDVDGIVSIGTDLLGKVGASDRHC